MTTTQQTYPPYSGDTARCPACGHDDVSTTYLDYGTCKHQPGGINVNVGCHPNLRLHRECVRCDCAWDEALVDGQVST